MKTTRLIGIGVLFLVIAGLLVGSMVTNAQEATSEPSFIGDPAYPAPAIPTGVDWLNVAAPLTLEQLKGKVVLLDFWTYGCINCIHMMPILKHLEATYGDALAVIGIDPVRYLVAPALIAMLVMLPLLTVLADAVAIFGAALYSAPALNLTPTAYMLQTLSLLTPGDVGQGIAKSAVFALLITLIGVSTGFSVTGGAEGVGRATTRAVVVSICWIIVADMIFSFFLNR